MGPANEAVAGGKAAQVGDMESAPAGEFDRAGFIAAVEARVNAQAPRTLEEADGFEKSGALEDVKQSVKETASGKKEAVTSSVDSATEQAPDPSRGSRKPGGALAAQPSPGKPPPVNAAGAMPRPKPAAATDLSEPKRESDQQMAQADISEEQLANSNEPAFLGALNDKKAGEQHSKTAPGPVRAAERSILGSAKAGAKTDESAALGGMFSSRQQANQQVGSDKQGSKSANEAERAAVAQQIESIYTSTQAETKAVLDGIDPQVDTAFETGEAADRGRRSRTRTRQISTVSRTGGTPGFSARGVGSRTSSPARPPRSDASSPQPASCTCPRCGRWSGRSPTSSVGSSPGPNNALLRGG